MEQQATAAQVKINLSTAAEFDPNDLNAWFNYGADCAQPLRWRR